MAASKFKPSTRKPPNVEIFPTSREALDELLRRIMVLGQAPYLYEGLAIRMAADSAIMIQNTALNDPRFKNHEVYGTKIDVFETDEGLHVSVDQMMETSALRAELGSQTVKLQPLWGPRMRQDIQSASRMGISLAEAIADKAASGHGLEDDDLELLIPLNEPVEQPGLDALRDIVKARQARMAEEEG